MSKKGREESMDVASLAHAFASADLGGEDLELAIAKIMSQENINMQDLIELRFGAKDADYQQAMINAAQSIESKVESLSDPVFNNGETLLHLAAFEGL